MRKELGEGQQEQNEPQDGEPNSPKNPRDPKDRRDGQAESDEAGAGNPQRNNVPAWAAQLPPQIRDALVRGDFEQIPPEYREVVERFIQWLLTQESPK